MACCDICCSVTEPVRPNCGCDVFFAAGTGSDPLAILTPSINIPFGNTLYECGDIISHAFDMPEFVVLKCGLYLINYQMSAYNPAVDVNIPLSHTVELISANRGVLDIVNFTKQKELVQRSIKVNLAAGDMLYFRLSHPDANTEMSVNSQAVSIVRL